MNEMKRRFSENDDVLNAVAALDPNSPFLLSTEMLTVLPEKYSSTLNLDLEHLNCKQRRHETHSWWVNVQLLLCNSLQNCPTCSGHSLIC